MLIYIVLLSLSVEVHVLLQPTKGETAGGSSGFGGSLPAAVCQSLV